MAFINVCCFDEERSKEMFAIGEELYMLAFPTVKLLAPKLHHIGQITNNA